MDKKHIFIDESGTLPDINDKFVVLAAVATCNPVTIDLIFKQSAKNQKGKVKELKFYTAGDRTKEVFLREIASGDFEIYLLIVYKDGRKVDDTPENYAALSATLLRQCFKNKDFKYCLYFDRHFASKHNEQKFNNFLLAEKFGNVFIEHVNSKDFSRVNIADMVAGATLAKFTGKTDFYFGLLNQKTIKLKRIDWVGLKKKFIKTKNLPEPM